MTQCPQCHGGDLVKTVFGTFKCPQCLYEEGKFDPPMSVRKNSDINSKLRKKDSPPPTCFNAHQYLEDCREKEKRRAQKRAEKEDVGARKSITMRSARYLRPSPVLTQKDSRKNTKPPNHLFPGYKAVARLAAIRALGTWGS